MFVYDRLTNDDFGPGAHLQKVRLDHITVPGRVQDQGHHRRRPGAVLDVQDVHLVRVYRQSVHTLRAAVSRLGAGLCQHQDSIQGQLILLPLFFYLSIKCKSHLTFSNKVVGRVSFDVCSLSSVAACKDQVSRRCSILRHNLLARGVVVSMLFGKRFMLQVRNQNIRHPMITSEPKHSPSDDHFCGCPPDVAASVWQVFWCSLSFACVSIEGKKMW